MDSSVVQEYNKQQRQRQQKPRRSKDIDNDRPMLTGWGWKRIVRPERRVQIILDSCKGQAPKKQKPTSPTSKSQMTALHKHQNQKHKKF